MDCKACGNSFPEHLVSGLRCPVCAADLRIVGRETMEPPPVVEEEPEPEPTVTTPVPAFQSQPTRRQTKVFKWAMIAATIPWLGSMLFVIINSMRVYQDHQFEVDAGFDTAVGGFMVASFFTVIYFVVVGVLGILHFATRR